MEKERGPSVWPCRLQVPPPAAPARVLGCPLATARSPGSYTGTSQDRERAKETGHSLLLEAARAHGPSLRPCPVQLAPGQLSPLMCPLMRRCLQPWAGRTLLAHSINTGNHAVVYGFAKVRKRHAQHRSADAQPSASCWRGVGDEAAPVGLGTAQEMKGDLGGRGSGQSLACLPAPRLSRSEAHYEGSWPRTPGSLRGSSP